MKRKKLPEDRAVGVPTSMNRPNWRSSALALAATALFGLWAPGASALGLGPVTVQSALGEPLRASIDIVEINAEEIASLRAAVASPEAFRAAGLEFSPTLADIKITLQRRPDGRHFLQLSSQRAVNDPFVDLILETQWASGRIVRDYTMLFDPANLRQNAPAATVQAPTTPSPRANPKTATEAPTPRAPRQGAPAPSAAAANQSTAVAPAKGDGKQQVKVQQGDTAGKIASASKPANVSLDQMLLALLHSNPDAFMGGNVNRLRAGAVLEIPSAERAGQEPASEARQILVAQSRDFNEFRRRLAEGTPTTRIAPADRRTSGKLQAQVQEKKPAPPSPDKLTLSKGSVQSKAIEEKIAREREAKDAAVRLAELNKNITELNRLGTSTPAAAAASAGKPSQPAAAPSTVASSSVAAASRPQTGALQVPAVVVSVPAAVPATNSAATATPALGVASAPAGSAASPASASASAPATAALTAATGNPAAVTPPASSPAKSTSPAARKAAPAPMPEPSFIDDLIDNPLIPAGLGLALVALLGFGSYKVYQRKKTVTVDSSFLESRLQPDSFFGGSGGQRVDTNEANATGSSMVYSPSQLDAAGDVDPVAEADVYLAYGRDLQAEEILKEAMRTTPQRVAIHSKLLEIYSKRRDAKAFELVATVAHGLTHGDGPEWEHICGLGQELDAGNLLYRPGGQPSQPVAAASVAAASVAAIATAAAASSSRVEPEEAAPASPVDLDLDLDISTSDGDSESTPETTQSLKADQAREPVQLPDMDFDLSESASVPETHGRVSLELPNASEPNLMPAGLPDLELADSGLSFADEPVSSLELGAAAPASVLPGDGGMIEFDLGSLSLDLDAPAAPSTAAPSAAVGAGNQATSAADADHNAGFEDSRSDPLATKFDLAQEFNAIGDPDGARSLAEEVLAEASGDLKHQAQRFLAEIG